MNKEGVSEIGIIGLMSGSSLDGVDLVYCSFSYKVSPKFYIKSWSIDCAQTIPLDESLLLLLKTVNHLTGRELSLLDHKLGVFFGKITQDFIQKNKLNPDFISSHGHTVFHYPKEGFTLQIGHPAEIVAATGLPVMADFRSIDVALKGQGAPLAPIVDQYLFGDYDVLVNLGGIMNLSFVKSGTKTIAYDVAPCNQSLNYLAMKLGREYDDQGKLAAEGKVNDSLLKELNDWYFFEIAYPKSLDNTEISNEFNPILDQYDISIQDKMATVVELIAQHLKRAILEQNLQQGAKIFITGGGAFNLFLINRMRALIPNCHIIVPDKTLVSFKEGLLLALLGLLRLNNQVNVLKNVTGCSSDHIGGAIYQGITKII